MLLSRPHPPRRTLPGFLAAVAMAVAVAACSSATPTAARRAFPAASTGRGAQTASPPSSSAPPHTTPSTTAAQPRPVASTGTTGRPSTIGSLAPLPPPAPLQAFAGTPAGEGSWLPAGRPVNGVPAVYETTLVPPGGAQAAGIAWMDTRLLSARLYSGSESPGGGPYRYTAPILPAQASSLVAAFNGGFKMNAAGGGYYTEGRLVYPLVNGAASLVIYSNGTVDVGAWNGPVRMTPNVVAVRQNLVPLVSAGAPTPQASSPDWGAWGATCGVSSCAASVPGVEHQWRSGVGVTGDGALVYATGPALSPLQLAQLLVRAGVVRGMQLDINPYWTVFVTYTPATPGGLASASNGKKLLPTTVQGPATFFEPWWARDFVTMSARSAPAG